MNGYLADTNILSEYTKATPDPHVRAWLRQAEPNLLFASVITLGELRRGVEDMPSGRRRTDLEEWLTTGMPGWFASNLLPVTESIADQWGRIAIQAKRRGTPLDIADGLIAATALQHDLTLVTRNVKDFAGLGLTILNPWHPGT